MTVKERSITRAQAEKLVALVAGDDGWWSSASKKQYTNAAILLASSGFTDDEITGLLTSLYRAAAEEYGG